LKAQAHLQSKVLKERESFSSSSCFYLRRVSRRKIPPAKSPGKIELETRKALKLAFFCVLCEFYGQNDVVKEWSILET
ncbi:hypothetical protein FCV25MIE_03847, partial [Fagus crenata]